MKLDIHSAVVMAVILTLLGALLSAWSGFRAIRKGRKITYYRLSRRQVAVGWWTIVLALGLASFAFLLGRFGEPVSFRFFQPSPSLSPTSTISLTPTISHTPTISITPSISPTPEYSYTPTTTTTPFLPMAIEAQFESIITPDPAAIFSPLLFSSNVINFRAINPQTVFENPVKGIYVTYSYDGMIDGVQWTAILYMNGQLIKYDTGSWEGGTGGLGQYDLILPAEQWLPGIYQLLFFVGVDWKVVGEFRVLGEPSTPTVTQTASLTKSPTLTPSLTRTPFPSFTRHPTDTRWPIPKP